MAQTFTNLLTHVIFSTKERTPTIQPEWKPNLLAYMGGIVRELDGKTVAIDGANDHVHMLLWMPPTRSISDTLRVLKTNSSRWINQECPARKSFAWQAGWLWRFQRESIQCASGCEVHSWPGEPSPAGLFSGRVCGVFEKEWHRIRRALHMGMSEMFFRPSGAYLNLLSNPGLTPWARIYRASGADERLMLKPLSLLPRIGAAEAVP